MDDHSCGYSWQAEGSPWILSGGPGISMGHLLPCAQGQGRSESLF